MNYLKMMPSQIKESGLIAPSRLIEIERHASLNEHTVFLSGEKSTNLKAYRKSDGKDYIIHADVVHPEYLERDKWDAAMTEEEIRVVNELALERIREKKEADDFEKAEKLTKWDGWVYRDGINYNNGYFESVADFLEYIQNDLDIIDPQEIAYVWACKENHFVNADLSDILERICDEAYEDFDPGDLNGLKELKAAIEVFNAANQDQVSYSPDYTKAVILPVKKGGE